MKRITAVRNVGTCMKLAEFGLVHD